MIKAAIFDMDGLLIDSEPLWQKVSRDIYSQVGVSLTEKDHQRMMGRTVLENTNYLYEIYKWGKYTPEEISDTIVEDMVLAIKADIKLMPGAEEALKICKQASLPIAIASGSRQIIIDAVVDKLKIREHFNHIYSAQHEPHGKPHPGVFIKTASMLGARPEDCVVFEDSASGVLAAKAAKMHCIAVPHPSMRDNKFIQTADIILESLNDFNLDVLHSLAN
jgi:mannitol-1-/sugar-/sorbitol-6-/2-deoxyglucose-6-phosphatase